MEQPPPQATPTGWFRAIKRKHDSWEVAYKNTRSGVYIEVMFNLNYHDAENLKRDLNDVLERYIDKPYLPATLAHPPPPTTGEPPQLDNYP